MGIVMDNSGRDAGAGCPCFRRGVEVHLATLRKFWTYHQQVHRVLVVSSQALPDKDELTGFRETLAQPTVLPVRAAADVLPTITRVGRLDTEIAVAANDRFSALGGFHRLGAPNSQVFENPNRPSLRVKG